MMVAEPLAGWEPTGAGPVHWLDVDGRQACDPSVEPRRTAGLNPWRAPSLPCSGCDRVISEFRALVERRGYELAPRFRYPHDVGSGA